MSTHSTEHVSMIVRKPLLSGLSGQAVSILGNLLHLQGGMRLLRVQQFPLLVEQVGFGDRRRRGPTQGSKALVHKIFKWEGGPKLVNSVWWSVEV